MLTGGPLRTWEAGNHCGSCTACKIAGYCCLGSSLAWEYNDLARRREYCILALLHSQFMCQSTNDWKAARSDHLDKVTNLSENGSLSVGNRGAPHPSGSRQVDWAARITHVQGEICRCLILVITYEKLRAVRRGATGRGEGLILVSAGYAHPCLFEDLILPIRNFKNIKFCRISVQFVLSCFRSLATTFLPATEAGTGG